MPQHEATAALKCGLQVAFSGAVHFRDRHAWTGNVFGEGGEVAPE